MTNEHDNMQSGDRELDELEWQRLNERIKALRVEIAPDAAAWHAIQKRIEASRVQALPTAFTAAQAKDVADETNDAATRAVDEFRARQTRSGKRTRMVMLAAASLLIAVTSIVAVRERETTQPTVASAGNASTADIPSIAPVAANSTEAAESTVAVGAARMDVAVAASLAQYNEAANDMAKDLETRRARLQPDALAVVDSCLHTLDQAIRESRDALRESPTNSTIIELLQLTYQQKLDLLRRSADLPTVSLQD